MSKLSLGNVTSLTNESSAITTLTQNNVATIAAMENTLSRDGTGPNMMLADYDMNSHRILNLVDALDDQEPSTYGQLKAYTEAVQAGQVVDASYVTLAPNSTLLNERALTGSTNIGITDTGPGGEVIVSTIDPELNALAALPSAADTVPYFTGSGTANLAIFTPYARTLVDDTTATAARATLVLDQVDNTSDATKNAATATLTNKTLTSPILVTPALGTPASGTMTNVTGTAAGLTAGHVTTNANLTGPITSTGNATAVASQTGTGSKFVMDTSPTLVTPILGTPTSVTLTNGTGLPLSGHTTQAAYTFVGNNTGSAATPTAVDISTLTTKATPGAGDYVILSDQSASGAWKKSTVSAVGASAGVSSIAGNTGAFTLSNGITNVTNDIRLNIGHLPGIATNTSAASGEIGEVISTSIVTPTFSVSGATQNISSVTLTAGDWDIFASVSYGGPGGTATSDIITVIAATNSSLTTATGNACHDRRAAQSDLAVTHVIMGPVLLSTSTTFYLNSAVTFTGTSYGASAQLYARRRR